MFPPGGAYGWCPKSGIHILYLHTHTEVHRTPHQEEGLGYLHGLICIRPNSTNIYAHLEIGFPPTEKRPLGMRSAAFWDIESMP